MFSCDMIFKDFFLHLLTTLSTFKELFWTVFFLMHSKISFFNSDSTTVWTINFKITYYFAQTHICFKSYWQFLLAAWTNFRIIWKQIETIFAYDSSALFTVKWLLGQLITTYTFHMLKRKFLRT